MVRLLVAATAALVLLGPAAAEAKAPPFVGVWKGSLEAETGAAVRVVMKLGPTIKSKTAGTIA